MHHTKEFGTSQPDVQPRSGAWRLARLLREAGFTEEQAAIGLGVDEATVRDWCNGNAVPPKEFVDALERLAAMQQRPG